MDAERHLFLKELYFEIVDKKLLDSEESFKQFTFIFQYRFT